MMKKLFAFTITLLSICFAAQARSDKKQVSECFRDYKAAILNEQTEKALSLLDSNTIYYYSNIASLSRTATRADIDTLPLMTKFIVLMLRHRVDKKDLLAMDGKGLLIYSFKNGLIDKSTVGQMEIANISVDDKYAKADCISSGQKTDVSVTFSKMQDSWKFNLTSLLKPVSHALNKVIASSGLSENDFIFTIAERTNGKRVDDTIWEPLASK